METNKKLLRIKEASEIYGLTEYFLRKGCKTNTIPNICMDGMYYICKDGFDELLKTGTEK